MSEKLLSGKTVLLGVTGGIAAYKSANIASMLVKQGACVHVLMTRNACNFIHPITFETLTGNKCIVDTFDRQFTFEVEHISLSVKADAVLIAPASADVIGKIACGIADDMLTTTVMACRCPRIFSPAMNTAMYENPVVQENIERMKHYGWKIVEPAVGRLACGAVGAGKMASEELLVEAVLREAAFEKDLAGKKVLVTAGATREAIDPVRFITNHSTGKMGMAIARMAMLRGACVTLVHGAMAAEPPHFVTAVAAVSAEKMFQEVAKRAGEQDMIFKAAAVADYTPCETASEKIKKHDTAFAIPLKRTQDILAYLGEHKRNGQFLCGFSMETENLEENSRKKLIRKSADMIVANNLRTQGAGFGTETNVVTLITQQGCEQLPLMSKEAVAMQILDRAAAKLKTADDFSD